jgi:hypothetical protein
LPISARLSIAHHIALIYTGRLGIYSRASEDDSGMWLGKHLILRGANLGTVKNLFRYRCDSCAYQGGELVVYSSSLDVKDDYLIAKMTVPVYLAEE